MPTSEVLETTTGGFAHQHPQLVKAAYALAGVLVGAIITILLGKLLGFHRTSPSPSIDPA